MGPFTTTEQDPWGEQAMIDAGIPPAEVARILGKIKARRDGVPRPSGTNFEIEYLAQLDTEDELRSWRDSAQPPGNA